MAKGFRDLVVWQKSMDLTVKIYRVTGQAIFPEAERFGLISQMRRAVISISSNIAEGHGRGGASFSNHLNIAIGSARELQSQMDAALRLEFVTGDDHSEIDSVIDETVRMLSGLRSKVWSRDS